MDNVGGGVVRLDIEVHVLDIAVIAKIMTEMKRKVTLSVTHTSHTSEKR
jgi:hypothetical protein